jgi:hypothetical protein
MSELLVIISGVVAGIVMWLPCGVGISAHRHTVAGVPLRSTNNFVLLVAQPPKSFSILGRIAFALIMLTWMCIFFGAAIVPGFVAQVLGLPSSSSSIGYALLANLVVAVVCFFVGNAVWRKVA